MRVKLLLHWGYMKIFGVGFIVVVITLVLSTSQIRALTLSYTAYLGTVDATCETEGYITPSIDTRNHGDQITINFKNEKAVPLQIRNFPGGIFEVPPGGEMSRSFTATSTFAYEAWLAGEDQEHTCKKATATINVNPATQTAPATTTSPHPQNEQNTSPTSTDENDENLLSDSEETPTVQDNSSKESAPAKNSPKPYWLAIFPVFLIIGGGCWFWRWHRGRPRRIKRFY